TAPSSVVTFTLACPLTVNVFATSSLRTCPALTSATTPTTNATTPNFRQVPMVIAITSTKPLYPSNASPPQNVPHSQPPVAPGTEFVPGSWVSSSSSLRTLCSLRPLRKPFSSFSYPFAALLFPRNSPKNSPTAIVLITSLFSSHPLRAIFTPYQINFRFPVLCESVEITTFTPRSLHIRRYTSFKSSRSGYELHSIATPCFAHAASIRSVIASRPKLKYEWIEHTTTSSCASNSSE